MRYVDVFSGEVFDVPENVSLLTEDDLAIGRAPAKDGFDKVDFSGTHTTHEADFPGDPTVKKRPPFRTRAERGRDGRNTWD